MADIESTLTSVILILPINCVPPLRIAKEEIPLEPNEQE